MAMQVTLVDKTDVIVMGGKDSSGDWELKYFRMELTTAGNPKLVKMTGDEAEKWYTKYHPSI